MRKIITILILLVSFAIPALVKAETGKYSIDKFVENAVITENGDVEVQEEITYNFEGDFNGVYRNLLLNGASGYTISEIMVRDENNNVTPILAGANSKSNTYELTNTGSEYKIKLFCKSSNEKKTFIFRYIIHGAAVMNETSGELYWNFYSVDNDIQVKEVELNLSLKTADFNPESFKYWSYVDGQDFTTTYDKKGIQIKGKNLTSLLGIRVMFQPEYLKIPIQQQSNYNNEHINNNSGNVSIEDFVIRDHINQRPNNGGAEVFIIIIFIIAVVTGAVYLIFKSNQKFTEALNAYRSQYMLFNDPILNAPPSKLPPALINLLIFEKNVSTSIISATLFYLTKEGYYRLEKSSYTKSGFFKKQPEEDLAFRRNYEKQMPSSSHLQYFINWLSIFENRGTFTLKTIEDEVSSSYGARDFKDRFTKWEAIIKQEASELGFYVTIEGRQVLSNFYYDQQFRWQAYKRYLLKHIDSNEGTDILSNVDEALIYASALEIGKDQLESLSYNLNKSSRNDGNVYGHSYYYDMHYYPFFITNIHMWDNIHQNINQHYGSNDFGSSGGSGNFTGGDGGGFGGFTGGDSFSGGGGGDSGAF